LIEKCLGTGEVGRKRRGKGKTGDSSGGGRIGFGDFYREKGKREKRGKRGGRRKNRDYLVYSLPPMYTTNGGGEKKKKKSKRLLRRGDGGRGRKRGKKGEKGNQVIGEGILTDISYQGARGRPPWGKGGGGEDKIDPLSSN